MNRFEAYEKDEDEYQYAELKKDSNMSIAVKSVVIALILMAVVMVPILIGSLLMDANLWK